MTDLKENSQLLNTALAAAAAGADSFREMRESGEYKVHKKAATDLVTDADFAAERAIISRIKQDFPEHNFLSEEEFNSTAVDESSSFWCIDPIDGTTNFAHGLAHVASSVAYIESGKIQVAVVNAPFLSEVYYAERGKGAFRNEEQIKARDCEEISEALLATGFPYDRKTLPQILAQVEDLMKECRGIRRLGACSLDICYVASGKLDGYFESVKPWDMAAGALIAKEAGASVGQFMEDNSSPKELRCEHFLVASSGIYEQLSDRLKSAWLAAA